MMADAARRYLARGWSVLPLRPRDKRPLVRWENLQNERPCEADIAEWFLCWPDANIGIVTGEISNLIVLDVDPKHGGDASEIPLAPLPRWCIAPVRGPRIGRSPLEWRRLVREGVAEGQRNSTIASLTGHLLWHGVDTDVALELLLAWNRMRCLPPLADAEVAQVVASITRLHDAQNAI